MSIVDPALKSKTDHLSKYSFGLGLPIISLLSIFSAALFVAACMPSAGTGTVSPPRTKRPIDSPDPVAQDPTEAGARVDVRETKENVFNTLTPALGEPTDVINLPLPWPLTHPSADQVEDAHACDIDTESQARYPNELAIETLPTHYSINKDSACDWAILAAAYADRAETNPGALEEGAVAWANALSRNAAYAFTEALFYGYFEIPDAVAAPPFTNAELTQIEIRYDWVGLGDSVEYDIAITDADTDPKVTGYIDGNSFSAELDVDTAQALGNALTGLFPVMNKASISVCTDNYPDWVISLKYENGAVVKLATNGSNVYGLGGPWWAEIEGQSYLQYSDTFLTALGEIIDELKLPIGQPAAQYCHDLESSLLEILFSQ